MIRAVLFDWGNTLMVDDGRQRGPMCAWPAVRSCPNVAAVLRELSTKYVLALATNADDSWEREIRAALKRVRLNRVIERVYCSNEVGARKPSPAFYAHILRDLALPPERIVMVGDSLRNDVQGAMKCGLRALWYCPGASRDEAPPGARSFGDFRQLPALLKELG